MTAEDLARSQSLPPWRSVLAVVAHPDDESFGLGAVLAAFAEDAQVAVLCFTHGEASTVHGVEGDLERLRAAELVAAGRVLGLESVTLLDHPDGALAASPSSVLSAAVVAAAERVGAEGLVTFDESGITGHPDHVAATAAALEAAVHLELPVLAWTVPVEVAERLNAELGAAFVGCPASALDLQVTVDRGRQRNAIACHRSQAVPGSVLWRRLELLGDTEHLRWLRRSEGRRRGDPAR